MKPLKILFLWHFFALTYVLVFLMLFSCFPEKWLFSALSARYGFIDIIAWDKVYMTAVLIASLIINAGVIYTFSILERKRRKL